MGLQKLRERSIKNKWRRVRKWYPLMYVFFLVVSLSCHRKGNFIPPVVQMVYPEDGDTLYTGTPSFVWQEVEDAEAYHIQIDTNNKFKTPVLEDSSLASPPFTPPVHLEDGEYYWRIRVKVGGLWGDWSTPYFFTIDTNPFEVIGFVETVGYAHSVWVDGNFAYVADGEAGVAIVDVSDPTNPHILGRWDGSQQDNAWSLFKTEGDSFLYVADDNGNVKILNVSDPSNPSSVSGGWARYARDIHGQIQRDTLFIYVAVPSGQYLGLNVFDASIPGWLIQRGVNLQTPGSAYGVFAKDDYVFLAVGQVGLYVANCQDPDNKYWVGNADTPGNARDIWVEDNLAFIADGSGGLQIMDITDPSSPLILSSVDLPGYARGVCSSNDTVFVASGDGGLQVVDATDPLSPEIIGNVETDYAYGVHKREEFVYLATRAGLYIIGKRID
jgi:hypothetical protein